MIGALWPAALLACIEALPPFVPDHGFEPVTQPEWKEARAEVARLRETVPSAPRVEQVRVAFRGPSGIGFDGRGAIAVAPGRALRMILLGPGGRTALDVWATPDRYRLAVPDLSILERGGAAAPAHLPIELFREWFLTPLSGRLLAAGHAGARTIYLVRSPRQVLELDLTPQAPGCGVRYALRKHSPGNDEIVEWISEGPPTLVPSVGSRVVFTRPAMGIRVTVEIEELGTEPPSPEAFEEPTDDANAEGAR